MGAPARVRPTRLSVAGAALGPEGSLPRFEPIRALPTPELDEAASPEMRARAAYGRQTSALPYARFSDYDRHVADRTLPALELTNGLVTALVLPGLGGRVWSLHDHTRDRELLHRNPVLQFANLGLSDAWFAGGIEWNLGSTGHSCLTTRPVHAAVLHRAEGDVLRLWEWERTRDLVLQVDLTLDGTRLVASTRVSNPDPEDKPLYYWTNVAVPETPHTRVLCAADRAWRTTYTGALERVAVPHPDRDGPDCSRPFDAEHAADYFYDVADRTGRVLAAVEQDGVGLGQTSTAALTGRKLFLWGHGPGGTRWQDWLSGPDARYCEIQAGVCPTQLEHDRLPGGRSVTWTETFGAVELGAAVAGGDYDRACEAATEAVRGEETPEQLEARHDLWLAEVADRAPDEVLATGSGWGFAELLLRGVVDRPHHAALPFPEVADASAAAVALVRDAGPEALDHLGPALPVPPVSDRWFDLLLARDAHWWVDHARAVNHQLCGRLDAAETAFRRSAAARPTSLAERGLALIARARGDDPAAVGHYTSARRLDPGSRELAAEQLELLVALDRFGDCLAAEEQLPDAVRRHGRTRLLRARALVGCDRTAEAAAIVDDLVVEDLAEGAGDLDRLWAQLHPDRPVPARLDFRMVREEGTR